MKKTIIILIIIFIFVSGLITGCVEKSTPIDDNGEESQRAYFKCLDGKNQVGMSYFTSKPSGWSESPLNCLTPCGFTKISTQYDTYFPYIINPNRACEDLWDLILRCRDYVNFALNNNDWGDEPFGRFQKPDHVCRHMSMELEKFIETQLNVDCVWITTANPAHTWIAVLCQKGTTYEFRQIESTTIAIYENRPIDLITHGNYIYGEMYNRRNSEPFIYAVSDWDDFDLLSCSMCNRYIEGTGAIIHPNSGVILQLNPLNPLEQFIAWIMGG